jgi:hypothetical protein
VNFGKRILLTFKELYVENGDGMCFSEIDVSDSSIVEVLDSLMGCDLTHICALARVRRN